MNIHGKFLGILLGCLLLCNVLMPAGAAEETAEFPIGTAVEQFISNTEALVSESEAEPPSASEYLYKDDFSDGELAQNLVKSGGNGTLSEANGELALTRTATSIAGVNASDGVQFWPSETHTGITLPLVGIEFTMKKSADKQFSIGFHDTADSEFIRLTFLKNGSISAQYRDLPEGGILSSQIAEQAGLDTYMKWNLLLNLQTKTFSIWKDDVLVLEDKYFTAEQIDFGYVEAVMEKRNGQTLTFDQFNAYSVVPDDATSVEIALADLQFENFTNETMDSVTHDLSLPLEGLLETSIAWTSSNPAAVSPEGTVTRSEAGDVEVVLTARVSKGGEFAEKQFQITVKRLVITQKPSAQNGYLIEDSLQGEAFDPRVETSGAVLATPLGAELPAGSSLQYAFDSQNTGLRTPVAAEFTMKGDGDTVISLCDTENGTIPFFKLENGNLWVRDREQEDSVPAWREVKKGVLTESTFILAHNPYMNRFSLWYGDDKVAEFSLADTGGSSIGAVRFEQNSGMRLLTGLKAYAAELPDVEKVYYDWLYTEFDKLTYQKEAYVTGDLKLSATGKYGSSIEWQSDNEAVVQNDGTVLVPSSGTVPVTLRARFYSGTEELERTYQFTVAALKKHETPRVKKMLIEENFDDNSVHTDWDLYQDGGSITVENEKLKMDRSRGSEPETIADMFFAEDHSRLFGIYGVEFTVNKPAKSNFWIRLRGNVDFFACDWTGANISCWNGINNYVKANIGSQEAHKFTLLFNSSQSKYTLWINDALIFRDVNGRGTNTGLSYLRFYMEKNALGTVELDNFKFYESYPLSDEAMEQDLEWLSQDRISAGSVNEYAPDMLAGNLNLETLAPCGTEITWYSSNESVLSTMGEFHPENVPPGLESVTLTAELKAVNLIEKKEFVFKVPKYVDSDAARFEEDCNLLDYEYLSLYENGAREIKRSLSLPGSLVYGAAIRWTSDDERYITRSGRVTRPRVGEENAAVNLTAEITLGQYHTTKTFSFIVLADEAFQDPQYMTDAEFFGVYSDGRWTTKGKLNYEYEGLEPVEEAVVAGDYTRAKEELLYYFQNRKSSTVIGAGLRNTTWVDMLMDDFYHLQGAEYYQGELWPENDWRETYAEVKPDYVSGGSTVCYSVRAWYNESSLAEIAGTFHTNPALRPKLVLNVNGVSQTIDAVDSVTVQAGNYIDTSLGQQEYLEVQTFGDFLGNTTKQAVIKFDLSGIPSDANISSARLVLYARALPAGSGSKRLLVAKEPTNTWESATATWNSFPGYIYSYNGLPDKNNWTVKPEGADYEYLYQMARFSAWGSVDTEYWLTQDDTYAYKAQRIVEDYITDVGNWKSTSLYFSYDPDGIRGGFPRSIDTSFKNNAFGQFALDELLKSPYATPDYCTALLKNIWDTAHYLSVYHTADATNWRQYEFQSLLNTSVFVPEFTDSLAGDNWREMGSKVLEETLFTNTLPDGSYIEGTGGYNVSAFGQFKSHKKFMYKNDAPVSAEYDKLLHLSAYYNALLYNADGSSLQYGDESRSTRSATTFTEVANWYNDTELEYIVTFGASGTKPEWTSRHFSDSAVTAMRADWSADSPYLFTNVRGGGGHSHSDDNAVIVSAYGRLLLNDAGIFTYGDDAYRHWAVSSRAHNTVVINDKDQARTGNGPRITGEVHDWSTNSEFDFLSQTTPQNKGYDHRRTITFLKPDIWIVSDLMTPQDMKQSNNYKQIWHMLPDAGLKTGDGKIYSTYSSGANVIVASADQDASISEENGWYDWSYQQVEDAKFAYVEKDAVTGKATFDSVIMAYDDSGADVSVEKLTDSTEYTALKLNLLRNGVRLTGYYMMTYNGGEHVFGKYKTDAKMAYVEEDEHGNIKTVQIKDGSYLQNTETGVNLVESEKTIGEVTFRFSQTSLYLSANADEPLQGIKVFVDGDAVSKVYVNGEKTGFEKQNGYITSIGEGKAPEEPSSGGNGGIITGGNGGGADPGGDPVGPATPTPTPPPEPVSKFDDMKEHWALEYVTDLTEKGIVKGKTETQFCPDDPITRAEFITMVVRCVDQEAEAYSGPFEDVQEGAWYAGAVQRALERGLISEDSLFRPNDNITREEMSKIIANAFRLRGGTAPEDKELTYEDRDAISTWAVEYVGFVSAAELMNGDNNGCFRPADNATRAESAAVISRMLKHK